MSHHFTIGVVQFNFYCTLRTYTVQCSLYNTDARVKMISAYIRELVCDHEKNVEYDKK